MLLRRNPFTILFSFIFVIFLGIGFIEVMYLAISSSSDRNVVACIIILGIIIYLIVAFLLKEGRKVQFFQKDMPVLRIIELCFVVLPLTASVFLNLESDIGTILSVAVLLVLLYGCSRLLGGRLCGMVSVCISFFFFLYLGAADYEIDHSLDILCFLIPYFVFLLITKKLTGLLTQQTFLLAASYILLGILFAFAIILNPLACVLLLGCFLSLLFARPETKAGIVTSGPFSAFILLFTALAIVAGVYVLMPDLGVTLSFEPDLRFGQLGISYPDIGHYLLDKYLQSGNLLYLTSETGIFPAILFFFAGLAGFYAIRKKASAIAPLCIAYALSLTYHLVFLNFSSEFFYMFYFLPIFSAYGIYNTLLTEEPGEEEEEIEETEETEEETAEEPSEPVPVPEPVPAPKPARKEPKKRKEKQEPKQENIPVPIPEPESVVLQSLEPVIVQETEPESEPVQEKEPENLKKDKKEKPRKKNRKEEKLKNSAVETENQILEEELPEWTAPDRFVAAQKKLDKLQEKEEEVVEESLVIEKPLMIEKPLVIEPAEEPIAEPLAEPLELNDETAGPEPVVLSDSPAGGSDLEINIPEPVTSSVELDLVPDEPVFTDTSDVLIKNSVPEDTYSENTFLSEDTHSSNNNMAEEYSSPARSAKVDNDADAQLDTLLNRLDISDNIRRMNESAREDIADIIERDEETNDLHDAKPAEEIDYESPVNLTYDMDEMPLEQETEPEIEVVEPARGPEPELSLEPELSPEPDAEPHSSLPKYVKPEFDFPMEPVTQPLTEAENGISEYDKVPTINDLEKKWRDLNETGPAEDEISAAQYSFAYSLEDVKEAVMDESKEEKETGSPHVHTEEIVRQNGMSRRSYHKITIG